MDAIAMDRYRYRSRKETPSFSSTLLDVIYQSVDERDDTKSADNGKASRNRQSIDGYFSDIDKQIVDSRRRSGGAKNIGFASGSQRSDGSVSYTRSRYYSHFPSSSSEVDRLYGFPARLKPLRTDINEDDELNRREININRIAYDQNHQHEDLHPIRANYEGKFVKTKSRAMKIYRYLKNAKQPISPGGRLASFVISLFGKGIRKSTISSPGGHDDAIIHANRKPRSAAINVSTPSSSCLNKTPSSVRRKVNIIDESLNGNRSDSSDSPALKFGRNSINKELKMHLTGKTLNVEETTTNLLRNYQKKVEYVFDSIRNNDMSNDDDDDDDEAASYASSDLFELDHLSTIGIDRCMQELPIYETTSVDANRAIANGLLL